MKRYHFSIKRLSDGKITHCQRSDDSKYKPKIPSGWNLENNHEIVIEDKKQENDALLAKLENINEAKKRVKKIKDSDINSGDLDYIKGLLKDILKLIL